MSIRMRDLLYTLAVVVLLAAVTIFLLAPPALAQSLSLLPPPQPGGAMPVTWNDIVYPTSLNWIGLYAPEAPDWDPVEYIFVNGCSHFVNFAWQKPAGTCGFVIPSTVPPGIYELRLFAWIYERIATSPRFQILEAR